MEPRLPTSISESSVSESSGTISSLSESSGITYIVSESPFSISSMSESSGTVSSSSEYWISILTPLFVGCRDDLLAGGGRVASIGDHGLFKA